MPTLAAIALGAILGPALLVAAFLVADQFEDNLFHLGDA